MESKARRKDIPNPNGFAAVFAPKPVFVVVEPNPVPNPPVVGAAGANGFAAAVAGWPNAFVVVGVVPKPVVAVFPKRPPPVLVFVVPKPPNPPVGCAGWPKAFVAGAAPKPVVPVVEAPNPPACGAAGTLEAAFLRPTA